jgi:uncharacterized flavoprotein (TIGR03862 family)
MAAEVLGRSGLAVTVFEHMPSVGRKLLLAGRGGLNITHSEPLDHMLGRYRPLPAAVENAIRAFDPTALRRWCAELGERTVIGTSGRVFPQSFRATPLLRAWLIRLASEGVRVESRHRWIGWAADNQGAVDAHCLRFAKSDGSVVSVASDVTVFALGGASWPRVGSDGRWVDIFRGAAVAVHDLRPSNCGVRIRWSTAFAERFGGVPLKNVAVSVDGSSARGDAMVTASGIEGGPIYAHSAAVRGLLEQGAPCPILIDLQPDLEIDTLTSRLDRRRPKESLATWLRRAGGLSPVAIAALRESTGNVVPTNPPELAALMKSVPLAVIDTMPIDRAISSAGGIAMGEIDDSFMVRRLPGTFVAGEMLDWDAPTGGYLLQASFATGAAAARGALTWLDAEPPCLAERT